VVSSLARFSVKGNRGSFRADEEAERKFLAALLMRAINAWPQRLHLYDYDELVSSVFLQITTVTFSPFDLFVSLVAFVFDFGYQHVD
jgi:hypothetical protein